METKITWSVLFFLLTLSNAFAANCRYSVSSESVNSGASSRRGESSVTRIEDCVSEALGEAKIFEAHHPGSKPTTSAIYEDGSETKSITIR
jgi:hypothetical protein